MEFINILHLSDLHFGIEKNEKIKEGIITKREQTLKPLLIKLKSLNKYWKPDIIAVSGDIGYTGKKNEYETAFKWFEKLLESLNLEPNRLIFCAGNHDRFRYEKDPSDLPISIEDKDNQLIDFNFERNSIPFSDFIEFQKILEIPSLIYKNRANYLVGTREILDLKFLILNSAWFAWGGDEDANKMILGKSQLINMKNESQIISRVEFIPDQITIAMVHHPPEDLDPNEIDAYKGREPTYPVLAECSDLILCGHKHGEKIFAPDKKFAKSWLFKTGASYQGEEYENNCEILHINLKALNAERLKINYIPVENSWVEEIDNEGLYLFFTSLSRLRIHTQEILTKIHDKIGMDCKVQRISYLEEIQQNLIENNIVFILGDPTVGKSVLLKDLEKEICEDYEVITFNINLFNHNSLFDYLKDNNINDDLSDILNSIKKKKICIFIDQSERILEDEIRKLNVFKDLLVKLQSVDTEKSEIKIVLSCRTDSFQHVYSELIHCYDIQNSKISAIIINSFSEEELSQVFEQKPNLNVIFNQSHLKVLLKNPKMLDILTIPEFKIFPQQEGESEEVTITETYLMDQFWKQVVRNNERNVQNNISPESRAQLLNKISIESFEKAEPYKITSDSDIEILKSLTSDNLLYKYKDQIYFSHDVYEEWALLDFIRNKSNIKEDFLTPFNSFKRKSRAFQLYSRYLLEIENDYETWKSLYIELENNSEINPNWIQELITGVLKSEVLFDLLVNLKDFLFDSDGNRLNQFLKILQLKCINFEGEIGISRDLSFFSSRPIYQIWFLVIDFILKNFQDLNHDNLYEFSEIIHSWLTNANPQVLEFIDRILLNFENIANTTILKEDIKFSLNYDKEKKLKKNIIYGIVKCKTLKQDSNLTIIDNLMSKNNTKWLFKDVLFEMYLWIPLYYTFPEYTIKLLQKFLIKPIERNKIIPTPFDRHEFEFSFIREPYFSKTSFKIMLDQKEECGLKFIHTIINQAMDLWKNIEEPVVYGPDFRRISNNRTPIPQIINIEEKKIELWGDDIVYKWPIHLAPTLIIQALQSLEEWIIKQIQQNERDPIELINLILSNTESFAVVSTCSRAILHILFNNNLSDTNIIENCIKSLMPILEKPLFWILHSILTSEEYVYYRKRTARFENIIEILLFYHIDLEIGKEFFQIIESFSENIPFIYEEEKSDARIISERQESINLIIAKSKKENYNPSMVKDFVFMEFIPPVDLFNKAEMEYQEDFLKIQSYKGTIFNALDNDGTINNYSIVELYEIVKHYFNAYDFFSDIKKIKKYFHKLRVFLDTNSKLLEEIRQNELPEDLQKDFENLKYLDWINDILELVTGFFSLIVIYHWEFVKNNKLEEKSKNVILKAVELDIKRDAYSAHTIYTMGIQQSAARTLTKIFKRYPKNKPLKRAIKKISLSMNHQVREILFTNLNDLWKTHPDFIWKLVKRLKNKSKIRAIFMNPEFLVINKYRDPRIKRSQFVDINWVFIKKLYVRRAIKMLKNKFSKKKFNNLTPMSFDLKFYRPSLNIIHDKEVLEISQLSEKISLYLEEIFYFTIKNDLQYKKDDADYSKMQSYYGDCRNHFYQEWIRKAINLITFSIFYFDNKSLTQEFLDFILSNWLETENFFEIFLEEFIIIGNQSELEDKLIEVWVLISESILNALKQDKVVKYSIISLCFFKRPFYRTLQNNFQKSSSLKKIDEIMKKFLEIKIYPDIIWLMTQIQNFELIKSLLELISVKIKEIPYEETKVRILKNNTSILLINIWKNFKTEILDDETLYQSFKFLVDKMVEWNSSLASKLQDDMKL